MVKASTIKVILSLTIMNECSLRQIDINNAFVNDFLIEEVYMCQPKGSMDQSKPNYVYKLQKALYDL